MHLNPYDRRPKARSPGLEALSLANFGAMRASPTAIAFEDIDALAASAFRRGEQTAGAHAAEQRFAESREDRRVAWDEGHENGMIDGRAELLARIDRQFGPQARALLQGNAELLKALEAPQDFEAIEELRRALNRSTMLLEELVRAHHDGFPASSPQNDE